MTDHHKDMASSLANMDYSIHQINTKEPIYGNNGIPISESIKIARNYLSASHREHLAGNHLSALLNLRTSMTHANIGVQAIAEHLQDHAADVAQGKYTPQDIMNWSHMDAAVTHFGKFSEKAGAYMKDFESRMPEIIQSEKDKVNYAKDIIDSIADENNLLLPGSYTNNGETKAPNGEDDKFDTDEDK